ncbi:MAG: quinone-dependent dihydroorotate dehydrogenase [Planctomycetota bacterium]
MYRLLRPLLFACDAEVAHQIGITSCRLASRIPGLNAWLYRRYQTSDPRLAQTIGGVQFPCPVGLAAGWDKSGETLGLIDAFGFGFAEIGSISARPSQGNARPRLFRVTDERAIVVNYGLPNQGAEIIADRFATSRCRIPLGANLVRTNAPDQCFDEDETINDYLHSIRCFQDQADYLMLNLSCPNADGGKDFFAVAGNIERLLVAVSRLDVACPVFLKVPPTDDAATHDRWLTEVDAFSFVKGFMFNLAPGKPKWLRWNRTPTRLDQLPGAVAGPPVAEYMHQCVRALAGRMNHQRHVLIGGGGISSGDDAWRQICSGASLLQVYSAFVYQGPMVAKRIHESLIRKLEQTGCQHLHEAIGSSLQA